MAYQVSLRQGTPSSIKAGQGNLIGAKGPKTINRVRDSSCSQCQVSNETRLYNCNIYAESLGQSHAGSMAVSSLSVIPFGTRFVHFVDFLPFSLTLLAPTILPPCILKDSPVLPNLGQWVSPSVSISCWLKTLC